MRMGEEISYRRFNKTDYNLFSKNLQQETDLLKQWFDNHAFSQRPLTAGYELEAWLIDHQAKPSPNNDAFLTQANHPLLTPELARFNIELNVEPQTFNPQLLHNFEQQLTQLWQHCRDSAQAINCNILSIGILPTLKDNDLSLNNISSMDRYKALNEQVLRQRQGKSIKIHINGHDHLELEHKDVMLEAAATSLQIHLQVPQEQAVRYYNASQIISAPLVAIGANSPYLFNKQLWQETRIPLFEQAVPTGGHGGAAAGPIHRVSFGNSYARDSLFECFLENQQHYPILLPYKYQSELNQVRHLRLHNGTIWRWNRPLIGFDDDGTPHLRIEHRVLSSAPSTLDNIANIALYYGLTQFYATKELAPELELDFASAKDNFYRCAQLGLKHRLLWTDKKRHDLKKLILEQLLPQAESGCQQLGIDSNQTKYYLGIIEARIESGQTGSNWQLQFVNTHNHDMTLLTKTYYKNQQTDKPIHEWDFET